MKQRNFAKHRPATGQHRCIYGVHPVTEWLRVRPGHVRAVHYDPRAIDRIATLRPLATTAGVLLLPCDAATLTTMSGTTRHQGVVAVTLPFPYADLEAVLGGKPRLLVIADRMQDPQNLGALLRIAAAGGVGAVIIPKDGASAVSPTVEAGAAGAAALVPVCRVTNIARTLRMLQERGYWIFGLIPRDGKNLYDLDLPERAVVVIGGEAGMRALTARHCDVAVSIPMLGEMESLNAAVAAAVVIYDLRRRWEKWGGA